MTNEELDGRVRERTLLLALYEAANDELAIRPAALLAFDQEMTLDQLSILPEPINQLAMAIRRSAEALGWWTT